MFLYSPRLRGWEYREPLFEDEGFPSTDEGAGLPLLPPAPRADLCYYGCCRGKGARLAEHAPVNRRYVASSVLKNKNQESVAPNKDEGMNQVLQIVYLARHGETAWTLSGQHTGLTDLPLTERGERNARRLQERLRGLSFAKVFTSPLQRAKRTCELAGFGTVAEVNQDLVEWNYGEYEGRRTAEIRAERPDWELFRDGCPGGESPAEAAARADRVVSRVRAVPGDVVLFSSGHFIRVLATRWIGLEVTVNAKRFMLSTASLSAVGYENELSRPVIRLWNDTHHVGT